MLAEETWGKMQVFAVPFQGANSPQLEEFWRFVTFDWRLAGIDREEKLSVLRAVLPRLNVV